MRKDPCVFDPVTYVLNPHPMRFRIAEIVAAGSRDARGRFRKAQVRVERVKETAADGAPNTAWRTAPFQIGIVNMDGAFIQTARGLKRVKCRSKL